MRMTRISTEGASPAMAQWFALQAANPAALLLFRMLDVYELFFFDALRDPLPLGL